MKYRCVVCSRYCDGHRAEELLGERDWRRRKKQFFSPDAAFCYKCCDCGDCELNDINADFWGYSPSIRVGTA